MSRLKKIRPMKTIQKISAIFTLLACVFAPMQSFAADDVTVSARVGSVNVPTTIQFLAPTSGTLFMAKNTTYPLLFDFADPDDTSVSYTVTPELITDVSDPNYDYRNTSTGSVSIENGSITDVTDTGSTDVQTNYYSPSTTGYVYVTVTANDGESVSSKKFLIYSY